LEECPELEEHNLDLNESDDEDEEKLGKILMKNLNKIYLFFLIFQLIFTYS